MNGAMPLPGSRVLPWLIAAALICVLIARVGIIPRHVHDIGFSEMNVVDGVVRLLEGRPLYGDPEQPPYDIMQYAPLHYLACAGAAKLLGIDAHDAQALYMTSRWVSLLANVAMCVLLWRIASRLGLSGLSRWLLPGLMFTWLHEPYFSRPDSIYLLCCTGLIGTALQLQAREGPGWLDALRLGAWSALTLFSKQSGVGVVAGVGVAFLLNDGWRAAWRYGLAAFGVNAAALAALVATNGWHNVYANLVLGNVNGWSFPWFIVDPSEPYNGMGLWITPVALLLAHRLRRTHRRMATFLLASMVVTYLWAFAIAGKQGANMNYFMEHWLLCALACLLFIERSGNGRVPSVVAFALTAMVLVRGAWFTWVFALSGYPPDRVADYRDDVQALRTLESHGLSQGDALFVVDRSSFVDQLAGGRSWLKQKDIIRLSGAALPLDHSAMFDNTRNGALRYVITSDTTAVLGHRYRAFTGWAHSFTAGRYHVYERAR